MANSVQAKKRVRQNDKRRLLTMAQKRSLRTLCRKVLKDVADQLPDQAKLSFKAAQKALDTSSRKGLIHKNKAARIKSRLNQRIKNLAQAQA